MGNTAKYVLGLRTSGGSIARDPKVKVEFIRAKTGDVIDRKTKLRFPPSRVFSLPAFPQEDHLYCYVTPSLFRGRPSDIFLLTDGERREPPPLIILRKPNKWEVRFKKWNGLPTSFKRLKTVLNSSPSLSVRNGPTLGDFVGKNYDDESRPKAVLAKTALLNLFRKLSVLKPAGKQRNWFSYLKRILSIDRERIIAEVQPGIIAAVNESRKSKEYKGAMASNHCGNFPSRYTVPCDDMFAIKSREDKGNVQITLAPSTDENGHSVLLLDADIDENGKMIKHLMDVLEHKFTGGTHPIDIHEYLRLEDSKSDFGYTLVPKS